MQDFFAGADTAMVDGLAVELQFVPNSINYQMGRTYLEAVSRPVPRALWAEKPRAAETQLMAAIWPQFASAGVGFSFSLFGEPYLNFGLLGAVAVAFAFGVFWRAAYAWFRRAPMNPFVISLYALSWPFLFVYMRGGLGVDYQRQVIYVLPVLLAYLFVRRSRIVRPNAVQVPHLGRAASREIVPVHE
jgi:oligosaccharide repeat unit polymerase